VIAVDTNILVYAHREDAPFHEVAIERVKRLAEGQAIWAIPWPCLYEFLTIVTHPRVYLPPTPLSRALDQVDAWLGSPTLTLLSEAPGHWATLCAVAAEGRVEGGMFHAARVAAICRQHGVRELWSADRDYSRFAKLVVINPLLPKT